MTGPADDLLEVLATITGTRLPDAGALVAALSLADVEDLIAEGGLTDEWPTRIVADALEELRQRASHQTELDRSIGGRRHRGGLR